MPTHAGDDHTYTRRGLLTTVGALAGTSAVAGCLGGESGAAPAWRTTELTDVRTDESFTLCGLEPPVLIENFAVWCPICTRQ